MAVVSLLLRSVREEVTGPVSRFVPRKPEAAAEPSALERAVLRAVTYASLFEFPMTPAEARRTIVGCTLSETELMALYRRSAFLQQRLDYTQGYFVPTGRDEWIDARAERGVSSLALIERHRRVLNVLCALPFISLVAVSGSLAHLNASKDSDLDLFVITRGPRVWTVTAAIVVISKLMGCRTTVCANYVVADSDMAVVQQDEFAANQIVHLRPLIGAEVYRAFLDANPFTRSTYPNFDPRERRSFPFVPARWTSVVKQILEALLILPAPAIEAAVRVPYGWYLRRKVRRWASPDQVRLTATQLKLHGYSHRESIGRRFENAFGEATRSCVSRGNS